MEEKILQTKKNGMLVLMLTLLGFVLDAVAFVFAIRCSSGTGCWQASRC